METAAYLRARAERCLQLARLMSDPDTARDVAEEAVKLLGEAQRLEARSGGRTLGRDSPKVQ